MIITICEMPKVFSMITQGKKDVKYKILNGRTFSDRIEPRVALSF